MKIITSRKDISSHLKELNSQNKSIGFVPTMGALHQGHLTLISHSKTKADITVASIFVNPTQFNNPEDLANYPKTIEQDIKALEEMDCDILFLPTVEEMYAVGETWNYQVGSLESKLEGEFRPGHYKGVTQIVYKLFNTVNPDIAFFGQKDYQQFLVIQKMCKDFKLKLELDLVPTVRENDGLAMSSRNLRLNPQEREVATKLYKALNYIKTNFHTYPLADLIKSAKDFFVDEPLLKLEYLKVCDLDNLEEVSRTQDSIALIACYSGNIRLIDNMILP